MCYVDFKRRVCCLRLTVPPPGGSGECTLFPPTCPQFLSVLRHQMTEEETVCFSWTNFTSTGSLVWDGTSTLLESAFDSQNYFKCIKIAFNVCTLIVEENLSTAVIHVNVVLVDKYPLVCGAYATSRSRVLLAVLSPLEEGERRGCHLL